MQKPKIIKRQEYWHLYYEYEPFGLEEGKINRGTGRAHRFFLRFADALRYLKDLYRQGILKT